MTGDTDQLARVKEDRLLKRERSYRGIFVGATFLCVAMFVCWFIAIQQAPRPKDYINYAFGAGWFWAAIASYAQATLAHIRTIKRYRQLQVPVTASSKPSDGGGGDDEGGAPVTAPLKPKPPVLEGAVAKEIPEPDHE